MSSDKLYTLVLVTPRGKALNYYYFKSKELAVEYAQMLRMVNPDYVLMIFETDEEKVELVWSKLEGMVGE